MYEVLFIGGNVKEITKEKLSLFVEENKNKIYAYRRV